MEERFKYRTSPDTIEGAQHLAPCGAQRLKLVIMGLMISSLFAISVSGQKITTIQELILQDDTSADHLIIVIATGEYKLESCKGNISVSGVGKVTVTGCKLDLLDISETRRVLAEIDLCEKVGKQTSHLRFPP